MTLKLHPQLQTGCYILGQMQDSVLLLHKNALIPWFILVPDTREVELYKMPTAQQSRVNSSISLLAHFVEEHFKTDKLNIATIGNIVPQLHVHIIGRHKNDFCWPRPVWEQAESTDYTDADVQSLKQLLLDKNLINQII